MEVLSPPALQPGDTIALISTARKVDAAHAKSAEKHITSWGFRMKKGMNLFEVQNQFAGTDAQRRADLQNAISDPEVKAILCARGGYGTARLLDEVDFGVLRAQPKWIIGYSDVTALHTHVYRHAGMQSIHGSMPINFDDNMPEALESIRLLLSGGKVPIHAGAHRLNRPGKAEGVMLGGNLSVLYSIMGTPSEASLEGAILFLEDLDEYLYHIDRMMLALKRRGVLAKLSGLVIGGMTSMRDNPVPFGKTAEEIIAEHVEDYAYPVAFGIPSGHITDNRAWVHGREVELQVNRVDGTSIG